jgi:rubrerythrin
VANRYPQVRSFALSAELNSPNNDSPFQSIEGEVLTPESSQKKSEGAVVDEKYWFECPKCGHKWKNRIREWGSCPRCGDIHTTPCGKAEEKE